MPKVEQTPVRSQSVLPNGGSGVTPATRRRSSATMMRTIAQAATLGAPVTSNPLGTTANG